MPDGKPAGIKCIHLDEKYRCLLFNDPSRPEVCLRFIPEPEFCGRTRGEALRILAGLSDISEEELEI